MCRRAFLTSNLAFPSLSLLPLPSGFSFLIVTGGSTSISAISSVSRGASLKPSKERDDGEDGTTRAAMLCEALCEAFTRDYVTGIASPRPNTLPKATHPHCSSAQRCIGRQEFQSVDIYSPSSQTPGLTILHTGARAARSQSAAGLRLLCAGYVDQTQHHRHRDLHNAELVSVLQELCLSVIRRGICDSEIAIELTNCLRCFNFPTR